MKCLKAKKASANEMVERLPPNHLRLLCVERAFAHNRGNEEIPWAQAMVTPLSSA